MLLLFHGVDAHMDHDESSRCCGEIDREGDQTVTVTVTVTYIRGGMRILLRRTEMRMAKLVKITLYMAFS